MVPQLVSLLKNYYALYLKLHNYHWNVEGAQFQTLHEMFENHYKQVAETIDTLGELIRGLGHKVPAIVDVSTAAVKPAQKNMLAKPMLEDLIISHEIMQSALMEIHQMAQKAGDDVIMDFIVERLANHRKTLWMLKSTLG